MAEMPQLDNREKDYLLTISIKNNVMLSMMKVHGIENAAELSRQSNISPSEIGCYLKLTKSAYTKHGEIRTSVKRLCAFFKCLPDHIFPEQHLHQALQVNQSSVEVSMEDLQRIPGIMDSSPDDLLIDAENTNALYDALNTLTDKQQQVLRMRFGLDGKEHTFAEIGDKFGISSMRVKQIEQNAFYRLRKTKEARNILLAYKCACDCTNPVCKYHRPEDCTAILTVCECGHVKECHVNNY